MTNEKLERLNHLNALIDDLQELVGRLDCWSNSVLPIEISQKGYGTTIEIPNELKSTIIIMLMANYQKQLNDALKEFDETKRRNKMATIKDLKRMCYSTDNCNNCPLGDNCKSHFPIENLPDCADEIIDKWVGEHPVKTYIEDYISKFPNTGNLGCDFKATVYKCLCCESLYGGNIKCNGDCEKCWNQEMKENA